MAKTAHLHVPRKLQNAAKPAAPLLRAFQLWSSAGGADISAAVSFYGILSLAPLLLAIVAILGWWMDRTVLQDAIVKQLGGIIGAQGTAVISDALASAKQGSQGLVASIVAFVVLLSGATGVFGQLQTAFEQVWAHDRGLPPRQGWRHTVSLRVRGIGYILVFGFLLLVSLVISTMLSFFSGWGDGGSMALQMAARVLNEVVSLVICTGLFAGLMRLSEGPKPRMRSLVFGAAVGALLFTIGRQLLAMYLAGAAVVSAYGAAGSLIVLLMWIYFSSAVLLFGAASARALEDHLKARQSGDAQLARGRPERRRNERRHAERRHAPV